MKRKIAVTGILFALALVTSCVTQREVNNRGPAYGHEDLFRQQLTNSKPVREWGYTVDDVKFFEDYHRAVIVFGAPGRTPSRQEATLVYDDKGSYTGRIDNHDLPHSNPLRFGEAMAMRADITVNLPAR